MKTCESMSAPQPASTGGLPTDVDITSLINLPGVFRVSQDATTITIWVSEARFADNIPDNFKGKSVSVHLGKIPTVQAPDVSITEAAAHRYG